MEEEKERGPDLMLMKVKGQFIRSSYYFFVKTCACFPSLSTWPDIVDTMCKCIIANQHFGVKNDIVSVFSSPRYLMSHTGYFSSSATVMKKVGTSRRWLKGRQLMFGTVERYLALLFTT